MGKNKEERKLYGKREEIPSGTFKLVFCFALRANLTLLGENEWLDGR